MADATSTTPRPVAIVTARMSRVTAEVTELPESRVRVRAEVAPDEVERQVQQTARRLGRDMRVPGFRKGKVPPPVIITRLGRDAVLDEAVRGALPNWYVDAIGAAGLVTVGAPELELSEMPREGDGLEFAIEIGVRPVATLGEYQGLEVGRREPEVDQAAVDAEVEHLRQRAATLDSVDRPAARGDFVVMDYAGSIEGEAFAGGEGRDQLVELGSGRLVPGFEDGLQGASAGEERTVSIDFPADYGGTYLAGRHAEFAVTVKEVKAKHLPDLDDAFAEEHGGFDTLAELRDDIGRRLRDADEERVAAEFRETALDAAVSAATIDVPEALVADRAAELWEQMVHGISRQGIPKETYLKISGKTEEELVQDARPEAEQTLRREAVIAAVVEAESVEPSDEDLEHALEHSAEHENTTPAKLLRKLREQGRLDTVRRELQSRRAVELIAESAVPISVEQARAREKLWTPEREGAAEAATAPAKLWTPGA